MVKIKEIMTKNPVKVDAHKTVREAINIMSEKKIGSLLVYMDNKIVGILEESDIITNLLVKDLNPYVVKVETVMSVPFIIHEDNTDNEASDMMFLHKVRHLAVSVNGKIGGVLSMQDLLRPVYSGRSFWT
jgi:CBS domain-containing protein